MPPLVQSCNWSPSTGLPALAKLGQANIPTIALALQRLRNLYWPTTTSIPQALALKPRSRPNKPLLVPLRSSGLVPDSGYASADSEDEGEDEYDFRAYPSSKYSPATSSQLSIPLDHIDSEDSDPDNDIDLIRSDVLERTFAIKWITGFICRSDVWLTAIDPDADVDQDDEIEARSQLIDIASQILSAFSSVEPDDDEAASITRTFSFSVGAEGSKILDVQLNDAALLSEDHTSVGLQSWGSAIIFAERICKAPDHFGFDTSSGRKLRVLELGAGTGLLSIVAAKLAPSSTVIATDYHPDVLSNLSSNVDSNFPRAPHESVCVHKLDWESPSFESPFNKPFDVILAADVVYNPLHAQWIHDCVEQLLVKPGGDDSPGVHGGDDGVSVFWLIIPLRSIGRHEGLYETVDSVFGDTKDAGGSGTGWKLAILERQELQRHTGGVGRVDEDGYRLFKIGWARG